MTDQDVIEESPPPYMIFILVFLFFVTGLLGFLICHLLKKSGYRCRTGDMDEEEEEEKVGIDTADDEEENQDTVEQILKCIIENEANMEAFKEMLGNQNICVRHDPRLLRKESLGGVPSHLHTVHSGSDHNSCHLCVQNRSKKNRGRSRTPRAKQRPGEQTVFSVGRFRVTHTDKKLHSGPQPLADSGDHLDQSQDSEDRKEGGGDKKEYNLRNMFKDAQQPCESSNGTVPTAGKRKKSLTIFGLRRASDPVGVKSVALPGGGGGGESGGVRFTQQPAVVLEEPVQTSSPVPTGMTELKAETEFKTGSKTGSTFGSTQDPDPTLPLDQALTPAQTPNSLPVKPMSKQTGKLCAPRMEQEEQKKEREGEAYSPGPLQTSTPLSPGPGSILGFKSRLPASDPAAGQEVPSGSGSRQCFTSTHTPLGASSTSSPDPGFGGSLASISLGSLPASSSVLVTTPSPPVQTPSPKLPQTSRNTPMETPKTPTPSPALTPSPKLPQTSRNTPEAPKTPTPSPALTPSPQLAPKMPSQYPTSPLSPGENPSSGPAQTPSPKVTPSSLAPSPCPKLTHSSPAPSPKLTPSSPASSPCPKLTPSSPAPSPKLTPALQSHSPSPAQTPSPSLGRSPHLGVQSGSVTSVTSTTYTTYTKVVTPSSPSERETEEAGTKITVEKSQTERVGTSAVPGNFKDSPVLSSPFDRLSKDTLSSLPLSPSSPRSPSSPLGGRISSITIVKASPDSQREFSVVTMVEEEPCLAGVGTTGRGEPSATGIVSITGGVSSTVSQPYISGVGPTVSQKEEPSIVRVGPTVVGVRSIVRQTEEPSIAGVRPTSVGLSSTVSQGEETFIAGVGSTVSQDRDDMMEMEDIRECRVRQEEERGREEVEREEKERGGEEGEEEREGEEKRTVRTQQKQE